LTTGFTIESWIYPYDWGENTSMGLGRIIDKVSLAIFLFRSGPAISDHSLTIYHIDSENDNGFTFTPENSVDLYSWQHIAVTYSITTGFNIYIDALEQELTQINPPQGGIKDNLYDDLFIGNSESIAETFDGVIDELRVWNHARSQAEIEEYMNTTLSGDETGLLAYWPMEEGNGDIIFDIAGNGNEAQIYNIAWIQGRDFDPTAIEDFSKADLPMSVLNTDAYPNPFNQSTRISFRLLKEAEVMINIYDLLGRKLDTIYLGRKSIGDHQVSWNVSNLSSGVYFYKVRAGKLSETKKILLLK
jgi:hypothetical protein